MILSGEMLDMVYVVGINCVDMFVVFDLCMKNFVIMFVVDNVVKGVSG